MRKLSRGCIRILALSVLLSISSCLCHARHGRITVGAERTEAYLPLLRDKKVAVVANQTSMIGNRHLVDSLLSLDVEVCKVFCPEHGFRGKAEAGVPVNDSVDALTRLPLISLYGKNKKPSQSQLEGVDVVVFDLQDVGCRFYTYLSTLHYVMEACAQYGNIPVVVLDRPNPNGHYVDGPVLEPKYKSFVGMHPGVPVVYGMTIGEYAMMVNGERWLENGVCCSLTVIQLCNYTHDSVYHLPVAPSPNLRTPQAIALYPSLCLFEGTSVSVGRGTPYPFEVIGNNQEMDLREVQVASKFDLRYLIGMYGRCQDKNGFFLKSNFFEKLAGNGQLRQQIVSGVDENNIRASWKEGIARFLSIRQKYLLYP